MGNGRYTSAWFDSWAEFGPLINWVSRRDIMSSGFNNTTIVSDLLDNQGWKWPMSWIEKYPVLQVIPIPDANKSDKMVWLDSNEVNMTSL